LQQQLLAKFDTNKDGAITTAEAADALAIPRDQVRVPAEGRSFAALTSRLTVEGVFVSTFHTIANASDLGRMPDPVLMGARGA
jgi:hypothetical protein